MEHAEIESFDAPPERVGVIVGSGIGGIGTIEREKELFLERGAARCKSIHGSQADAERCRGGDRYEARPQGDQLRPIVRMRNRRSCTR